MVHVEFEKFQKVSCRPGGRVEVAFKELLRILTV